MFPATVFFVAARELSRRAIAPRKTLRYSWQFLVQRESLKALQSTSNMHASKRYVAQLSLSSPVEAHERAPLEEQTAFLQKLTSSLKLAPPHCRLFPPRLSLLRLGF